MNRIEFKKYRLGDIASVEISSVDKKSYDDGIPVRLCNFVDVYHNWAITESCTEGFMKATANNREVEKFLIRKGQVAITKDSETRDDIGISTYIADNFYDVVLGYHCALITPNQDVVCGKYLNAFMHTSFILKYFENNASGSGQRFTLSVYTLNDIPVLLPNIKIQQTIGKLLADIDRKIELNKAINHNLEALAKQLYDYWFVQFDFPDENGQPYKSSGGKMVWNDRLKREIPEGWEVKNLFEATDVIYGYPYSTEPFDEDNLAKSNKPYNVIRIRDIANNSISAKTTEEVDDKYKTEINDLLIGMDGYFHMNFWSRSGDYVNQRIVRIRKTNLSTMVIYHQIKPYIQNKEEQAKGSTVGHLSDKDMKMLFVTIPNNKCLSDNFDVYLDLIAKNKREIEHLCSARDNLLPLLMNGQATITQR